jgi:hypothetical protein
MVRKRRLYLPLIEAGKTHEVEQVELTIALDAEKRKFVIRPRPQQRFFVGLAALCKASGLTTGRQVAPAAQYILPATTARKIPV